MYFINVIIELTVILHIFVVYLQILTNINVMEKIKTFKGKNLIVNEIKQFLIDKNSDVALINCEHIGSYESKKISVLTVVYGGTDCQKNKPLKN